MNYPRSTSEEVFSPLPLQICKEVVWSMNVNVWDSVFSFTTTSVFPRILWKAAKFVYCTSALGLF